MILKQFVSYLRDMTTEGARRSFIALNLSLRYGCRVHHSCHIDCPERVSLAPHVNIGERVHLRCPGNATIEIREGALINPFCVLMADCGKIVIGQGSSLQYHSAIYGTGGVHIGEKTRISANVLILATIHKHHDRTQPTIHQGITGKGVFSDRMSGLVQAVLFLMAPKLDRTP